MALSGVACVFVFLATVALLPCCTESTRLDSEQGALDMQNSSQGHDAAAEVPHYRFDHKPANDKKWVRAIAAGFDCLNVEAETELRRRRLSNFKTAGPRTFVLTVGAMGSGKSYIMKRLFGDALHEGLSLGARSDYVLVDPDAIRCKSPAFIELQRVAKEKHLSMPKDLLMNTHLRFKTPTGEQGPGLNWLDVGRGHVNYLMKKELFNPASTSSAIYDSSCSSVAHCADLIRFAHEAGYERLVVLGVHVDVNCAIFRAGVDRAQETGRIVPNEVVIKSHASTRKNAKLLAQKGHQLFHDMMLIEANPKAGTKFDEHRCAEQTELTSEFYLGDVEGSVSEDLPQ